jgi:hypothetical protein
MTTVNCGYEGCNWQRSVDVEGLISEYGALITSETLLRKSVANDLIKQLLNHLVAVHNVPPAIWER